MGNLIGIDIGGTKTAVLLGEQDGGSLRVLKRMAFPTETALGPQYAINKILGLVQELSAECGSIEGIGVSCGGPLDSRRGLILSPPNLPGWDGIPIVKLLEDRFHAPAYLQNDANACALAEWRWGAAKGTRNAVFLTFGTGMGAGLILDGRLYSGTNDMAGEAGHIRLAEDGPVGYGKAGSFEGFCSGGGIARLARAMAEEALARSEPVTFCASPEELELVDARAVAEAARRGDRLAQDVFRTSGRYLGRGLSVLIDILNPEVVVIGSIFARSGDLLWPEAQRVIAEESLGLSASVCRVVPAQLGEAIGDMAALAVAATGA